MRETGRCGGKIARGPRLIYIGGESRISHQSAVRALERAGFSILREGTHIFMTDGKRLIIPRHHVIKPGTLRYILDAAELTVDQFNDVLH